MKKNLTLLLFSVLLVFSLTACGGDDKNVNTDNQDTPATDDSTNNDVIAGTPDDTNGSGLNDNRPAENNGTGNGTDNSSTGDILTGTDGENAANSTVNQSARTGGVTYGQMLRNARVHDTNGNLKDLENAVTPGSAHFY
ncbi:hypothetical protein SAMN05216343_101176 [Oscillibacter sp. PC13]|uniref:hypothetical protein n=1 Tax=Oscillibacter sp. PC13 TaxID=1855299 RepID=UPI0008EAD035|nr:hypothetical protein [Oscillibacter sp. PC13]SFO97748.1 hypothetical protein SAMN05216343_101176 [Oscillibacter sp. PC13]